VYSLAFPNVKIVKTGSITAEMVKYFTNTFLATKVSFANEMKQICDGLNIDYDKVVEYSTYDERLGKSHWAVPGPDGHYGFGGSCFPKDINALINVAKDKLDLYPNTLIGAWETNCEVRPEKDWEELKGRAVVDE
jgi:UDP-glucose 6-dehydrogenase